MFSVCLDVADVVLCINELSKLHGLLGQRQPMLAHFNKAVELARTLKTTDDEGNIDTFKTRVLVHLSNRVDEQGRPLLQSLGPGVLEEFDKLLLDVIVGKFAQRTNELSQNCSNPECGKKEREWPKFKKCGRCLPVAYCGVPCATFAFVLFLLDQSLLLFRSARALACSQAVEQGTGSLILFYDSFIFS